MLVAAIGLSACGSQQEEKKPGQALVSVNGEEITMLQLNDELRRANVRADQREAASEQLLESLIARQLIVAEAVRNKLDRTPEVMQSIERAKAQIIAQTYLQGIVSKIANPAKAEIDEYFLKHPEFFTQRKQFDMTQLLVATRDLSNEIKSTVDTAKSLDEVAAWLDAKNIPYARNQLLRSTADLPPEIVAKLQEKSKKSVFIINEQENSSIITVNAIKDSPVTAADAAPQIERYLTNKKYKAAGDAEVARLRSSAKIEYLNASPPVASVDKPVTQSATIAPAATMPDINPSDTASDGSIERGISGLK
ncbi:MAG: EpsD family peptidyl-prolyl cis-trans isomerase [Nitrosomonas sp.]|nr:EpsD family peptidyl-prolyl cis-trans isomerase [Nitrosomonas sp.]MDP1949787.1 EpsD family peptidyl-prolyl cis-trans isomerase [Nitrosomonas sp.]